MEGERNPETEIYIEREKKRRFTMRHMDTRIQYEFLSFGAHGAL